MNKSMRIRVISAAVAITAFTLTAEVEKRQLATTVVAKKQALRLGDPIKVSVVVSNRTQHEVKADRGATALKSQAPMESRSLTLHTRAK